MSQPKRYDVGMKEERCDKTGFCTSLPWVYPSDDGKYVLHADYAALQAENERLRKAGDAMHLSHEANFKGYPYTQNQVEKAMKAWLAAKGVQP